MISINSLLFAATVARIDANKMKDNILPTAFPYTISYISISVLFGYSDKSLINKTVAKKATNPDISVIYQPAVPTFAATIEGLEKNTFADIVIVNKAIVSWTPNLPSFII